MDYGFTRLIGGLKRMKQYNRNLLRLILLAFFFLLAGCSDFNGIRTPLYDGEPVAPNDEAISTYQQSREIIGEEKAFYLRYPFSEDIYQSSLDFTNDSPVLLEAGSYVIGEDIPAGRASIIGNESVFTSENNAVHVGHFMIRDSENMVYFENVFHSDYGPLVAQVDFIHGHTIEIIGDDPEITVFYGPELPADPYQLMDPPELLVNMDRLEFNQPIVIDEAQSAVTLTAGIYEVGIHLEPGHYEIKTVQASHSTELIRFRSGAEPAVFELHLSAEIADTSDVALPIIELQTGDKIYPSLVDQLELVRVKE